MNAIDLINALQYIDDDLIFDAADGGAQSRKSAGAASAKQPRRDKPPRGGAKAKAILIGALACVCVAAMVCAILYFTGVFDTKQIPIYQGMEISSAAAESSQSGKNAASYSYSGDYVGKSDDVDKDKPFGGDSPTIEQETQSTLLVAGAGESIYYADAGDDIYITIKFSNPDSYEILSFVINGEKYTSYMFETGSDLENIIIKVNVGSVGGIIDYTISEIKYVDGTEIKDVVIDGDTVVKCGVRTSDITYASIQDEEVTFTSISFTVKIVDLYSLVEYSSGYLKAVLYDGESLAQTVDLQVGTNEVVFDNLLPDTLYQYAVVGYYDSLNGDGIALNYLYINTVYTTAVVLFDNIEVGQDSIIFGYSWNEGYESRITSLTLTGGVATQNLSASATSITGLLSDTEYKLTAYYALTNGETAGISIEFTTEAKAVPELSVVLTGSTASSLTFELDISDKDSTGSVTSVRLYNGSTLVKSQTNLNQVEYTFSGLSSYTQYTLKVVYTYNLNDSTGTKTIEKSLSANTDPVVEINSISVDNTTAIVEGGTIYITANVNNPSGVTFDSVVVNGITYTSIGGSKGSTLYVDITNSGQFDGGTTTLTITQINCTIGGKTYSVTVNRNNTISVLIYGELTIENFIVARYNSASGKYEETYYGFPDEQLYYVITLGNATKYNIDSITIGGTKYSSSDITVEDYQTVYIPVDVDNVSTTISSISYSYGSDVSKIKPLTANATYFIKLQSSDIVEITSAEDLVDKIDGYRYYRLMNDIDLSDYEWVNKNITLRGVFDGNGHKIIGMGAKTTYENVDLNIALFSEVNGVVTNLTLAADYRITLNDSTTYRNVNIGGIANTAGSVMIIDNVNVELTASVITNADIEFINAGGLSSVGGGNVYTKNVTVKTNISITTNGDVYQIRLGGLYGYGNCSQLEDADVTFTGEIITAGSSNPFYIGGLFGLLSNDNNIDISDVTITSEVTIKGSSVDGHINLGGIMGYTDVASLGFYNVDSRMTADISSDLFNVLEHNEYRNGITNYTNYNCNVSLTINKI